MLISCGRNQIVIETTANSEIRLIFKMADYFIEPFVVDLSKDHASALVSNLGIIVSNMKNVNEGREKAAVLRDIRTKLLAIYSEDEDVENELDCATDELTDAIEKLEDKYGK